MPANYSSEQISKALFETDPMNTCCKENDCFDEYDRVAQSVASRLSEGESLERALIEEISVWFYDGDSFEVSRLEPAIKRLTGDG